MKARHSPSIPISMISTQGQPREYLSDTHIAICADFQLVQSTLPLRWCPVPTLTAQLTTCGFTRCDEVVSLSVELIWSNSNFYNIFACWSEIHSGAAETFLILTVVVHVVPGVPHFLSHADYPIQNSTTFLNSAVTILSLVLFLQL